ncbi:type 1 glutamine amidotransferase domain-containing protein [Sandaracinobacter sp. RS1-74]|uniref:type 1 glutamine amidotransferase domain-containing protein n=1 Tax=Sandaracinobacteroides sayramensis TaxID=2913411 RepID=UPI001EDBBFA6|nr:type 1 glutamine amidotransferase domain-containing protein [Sandaracinobacteroides sayramensis]MCG2842617.1 type 1 glutamine amidotransferase domain-containing protein [Sandaracinobacteroides sayramensis]
MAKSVLFVLTSHSDLGASGQKTGTWLEELASAYYRFLDSGHEVALASVSGGAAPLDPASLEQPWLTEAGVRFQSDPAASGALASTAALADIDPAQFHAVYYVGGAGAAWDFPTDPDVRRVAEAVYRQEGVVSGVCHGVLGLTTALDPNGHPLLAERRATGVSNKEEELTGFDKLVPVLPEARLVELGASYSAAAEPFGAHVVSDGRVVTGQNPASAPLVAETVIGLLAEPSA